MKKKVLVGLILLSVLAFGVAYKQPCIAGGCVDEGSSYNDWLAPDYSTASEPECVTVSDMGETISVLVEDMDCGGSQEAYFYINHNVLGVIDDVVLGVGDSRTFSGMELSVSDIFCGANNYHVVEIELGYESPPPTPTPPPCAMYGDVNGDGSITDSDWQLIEQHILEIITLDDYQQEKADVNNDGRINMQDVTCIEIYIAGGQCGRTGQCVP